MTTPVNPAGAGAAPGGGPSAGAGGPVPSMTGATPRTATPPRNATVATPRAARRGSAASQTTSATRRPKPAARPPRLASLQLRRIDPWTALKIGLIVSIVMFFVWMIAVGVLYLSLDALSVWDKINETYNTLVVSGDTVTTQSDLITPGTVFGVTAIIGAVNIVLFTALSAIAAFVYNAAAGMAGGVELTLGERD